MADNPKTGWDKAQIILGPVGGLFTALAVASLGFFGSRYLNAQQESDTKQRVYAELMSKREEADVSLRKDMFNSIIGTFVRPTSKNQPTEEQVRQDVLKLELLAYNFHDSLDLGPLFKQVYKQIDSTEKQKQSYLSPGERTEYLGRLQKVATVVTGKQISALREAGNAVDTGIDLKEFEDHPEGITVYDHAIKIAPADATNDNALGPDYKPRLIVLELLKADYKSREIEVRLRVSGPGFTDMTDPEVDKSFWVGFFDFPMIDNTRLSHDQRCAVVLKQFDPDLKFAEISLVYFPGDRASLKEKPFYDEVLHSLHRTQERVALEEK